MCVTRPIPGYAKPHQFINLPLQLTFPTPKHKYKHTHFVLFCTSFTSVQNKTHTSLPLSVLLSLPTVNPVPFFNSCCVRSEKRPLMCNWCPMNGRLYIPLFSLLAQWAVCKLQTWDMSQIADCLQSVSRKKQEAPCRHVQWYTVDLLWLTLRI